MTTHDIRIPAVIQNRLAQLLHRFRGIVLMRGLALTLGVFLAASLVSIGLDLLFPMPMAVRVLITSVALGVTLLTAWAFWIRPWLAKPDDVTLAATVEVQHPELQERISSTIEFITHEDKPEYRGSAEMIAAVAEQASESSMRVDFASVISAEHARRAAVITGFLVLVTGAIALLWWQDFSQCFQRFIMPWANIARVSSTSIVVQEPADKVVAKGWSVQIAADVTPATVGEATLYLEVQPGRWVSVKMTAASGSFTHRISDVTTDMRYYIRAADGETRRYSITAIERPKVTRLDLRYDYPAYTKLKAKEETNVQGDIRAIKGTDVSVTVQTSKEVEKARLEIASAPKPVDMERIGARTYRGKFTLASSGFYTPRLEDEFGFTNVDEEVRQIIADEDAVPVVRVVDPDHNIKLHSPGTLPVTLEAKDDFGVMELAVSYQVNEGDKKEAAVPLKQSGAHEVKVKYGWNLAPMKLQPGDLITYRAKAVDNRPGMKPNVGWSETHTILITSPKAELDEALRAKQLAAIKKKLQALKEKLEAAHTSNEQLDRMADQKQKANPEATRAWARTEAQLKAAEPIAKDVTEAVRKDPLLEPLTAKAEDVEKKHIPEAEKAVAKTDLLKPLEESKPQTAKADKEIGEAIKKVDEMLKEVDELAKLEDAERKLDQMARKEQDMADKADKTKPEDKATQQDLANQQDALKDQAQQFMNEDMKQEAMRDALQDLKDAAEKAKDLAEREKDLKKRTEDALAKKLDDIKKRQEDLNKEVGAAKPEVQPKLDDRKAGQLPEEPMKKAAEEIGERKLDQAIADQKKAADEMKKEADALNKPAPQPDNKAEKPAAPEQAKKMDDFAKKQDDIRKDLEQVAAEMQAGDKLAQIEKKQEELKQKTEDLQKQAEPQVDKQQPRGEEAPKEMQQAINDMKADKPEEAPAHQEDAAKKLDELAKNLDKKPEAKPLADKAKDLAKEQRDLKNQLEALTKPKDAQMKQLANEQKDLEKEANELEQDVKDATGQMEQAMPQGQETAKKANEAMKDASKHMDKAEKDLNAGQAKAATPEEQAAADALEQAAGEMMKLADQAEQALNGKPENGPPESGAELAKALSNMKDASAEMRDGKPEQGSQSMQKAAQALSKAAQKMMGRKNSKSHQSAKNMEPKGIGLRNMPPGELDKIRRLDLTTEEWNKLPGELKEQILQSMQDRYPEEYRQLISDYFKRLAETGVKAGEEKK